MKLTRVVVMTACIVAMGGCGLLNNEDSGDKDAGYNPEFGLTGPTGCIQGTTTDALTGDPIPLPKASASKEQGIFVVVRNNLIAAKPAAPVTKDGPQSQDAGKLDGETVEYSKLTGEYAVCGIPLDETFPVFAWIDGYRDFQGEIHIKSKHTHIYTDGIPADDADGDGDADVETDGVEIIERAMPTDLANIRLFKKGTNGANLEFRITSAGEPVANALVQLAPVNSSAVRSPASDDYYLTPQLERVRTLRTMTDESGKAIFAASDLVFGATYDYMVIPKEDGGFNLTTQASLPGAAANRITYGLMLQADDTNEPYVVFHDLEHVRPAVQLIAKSTETHTPESKGAIRLTFNRPVETIPGTLDELTAALSGQVSAELVANVANNNVAEQVGISFEDDNHVVVLTPIFVAGKEPNANSEYGLRVLYAGLKLRAISGTGTLFTWSQAEAGVDLSVSYYGGETLPAAQSLSLSTTVWEDAPAGGISTFVVTVLDQHGAAFANSPVTIAISQGNGRLGLVPQDGYLPDVNVTETRIAGRSDVNGRVTFKWRLDSMEDYQSVTVSSTEPAITPVSMHAEVILEAPSRPARVTSNLPALQDTVAPSTAMTYTLTVFDQYNVALANQTVLVTVQDASGTLALVGGTGAATQLQIVTDANGQASFVWTVGATVGTQMLKVDVTGADQSPTALLVANVVAE